MWCNISNQRAASPCNQEQQTAYKNLLCKCRISFELLVPSMSITEFRNHHHHQNSPHRTEKTIKSISKWLRLLLTCSSKVMIYLQASSRLQITCFYPNLPFLCRRWSFSLFLLTKIKGTAWSFTINVWHEYVCSIKSLEEDFSSH